MMNKTEVGIKTLNVAIKKLNDEANIPEYKVFSDSGCDLKCTSDVIIPVGKIKVVGTGIAIKTPHGYEAQIRPRSGLASKRGLSVINTPGTIDSGYTGEIKVALINLGEAPVELKEGDRFAQMVFCPVYKAVFHEVHELELTDRADGGFGHTGI
jgi:dUTP pyrophosphatase